MPGESQLHTSAPYHQSRMTAAAACTLAERIHLADHDALIIGCPTSEAYIQQLNTTIYEVTEGEPFMIGLPYTRFTSLSIQTWTAPAWNADSQTFHKIHRSQLPSYFILNPVDGMSHTHAHYTPDHGLVYTIPTDHKAPIFAMFPTVTSEPFYLYVTYAFPGDQHGHTTRFTIRTTPLNIAYHLSPHAYRQAILDQVEFNLRHEIAWQVIPLSCHEPRPYSSPLEDPYASAIDRFHHMAELLTAVNAGRRQHIDTQLRPIFDTHQSLKPFLDALRSTPEHASFYAVAFDSGHYDLGHIANMIKWHTPPHDGKKALTMARIPDLLCQYSVTTYDPEGPSPFLVARLHHAKHHRVPPHPMIDPPPLQPRLHHWYVTRQPDVALRPDPTFQYTYSGRALQNTQPMQPTPTEHPLEIIRRRLLIAHCQDLLITTVLGGLGTQEERDLVSKQRWAEYAEPGQNTYQPFIDYVMKHVQHISRPLATAASAFIDANDITRSNTAHTDAITDKCCP